MKTFKVRIISAQNHYWYADRIGEVFEVKFTSSLSYTLTNHDNKLFISDCEVITDELEQFMFQGYPLNVSDKLYNILNGWVTVTHINPNDEYPIDINDMYTYTVDGKRAQVNINPVLFWDEPKFELPKKPVPKIKKYLVLFIDGNGNYQVSKFHYENLLKFVSSSSRDCKAIHLILESEREFDDE